MYCPAAHIFQTVAPRASAARFAASPDRREAILSTARRLWAQLGYHSVSLRRIANEAGVTLSLIDHHFGAKDSLFAESVLLPPGTCRGAGQRLAQEPARDADQRLLQFSAVLLAPPVQCQQSATGRDLLQLWLRHRHETLPEVRVPLDRAVEPLLRAVVNAVCKDRPDADRSRVERVCETGFCHGVEWVVTEFPRPAGQAPDEGSLSSADIERLQTRLAMGLRIGLAHGL